MQTMFVYMIAFAQQRFPTLDDDATGRLLSTSFLALNAVAAVLPALVLLPLATGFGVVRVHAVSLAIMAAGFAGVYLFAHTRGDALCADGVHGHRLGRHRQPAVLDHVAARRPSRIGLYMGVFNLSIVLPQLVVSLGVGTFVGGNRGQGQSSS